mmetsp:Transcript_10155/g.24658  ORF Transcript_10155/g.24658 Transcript_10155/m.24658 type:complete len:170 (-) Transcript_10155:257-766(-)
MYVKSLLLPAAAAVVVPSSSRSASSLSSFSPCARITEAPRPTKVSGNFLLFSSSSASTTTGHATTNLDPEAPYDVNGLVFEKEVVGFSSSLAFDGRPKSSCSTHDEDAQGDGSSDDGIDDDDDDEEEKEDEGESAPDNRDLVLEKASTNSAIGIDTVRHQQRPRRVRRA